MFSFSFDVWKVTNVVVVTEVEDARVDTMVVVEVATPREEVVAEDTVKVANVRVGDKEVVMVEVTEEAAVVVGN